MKFNLSSFPSGYSVASVSCIKTLIFSLVIWNGFFIIKLTYIFIYLFGSLYGLYFTGLSIHIFSSVQFSRSVVSDSLRPHESQHARPPCPSPTPGVHSDSTSIKSAMPSSHLILCRPLLLLPPIPPSIRVFSNESILGMRWPKYWNFSFSIIPSKGIPGLISFRMDWLDLVAAQGTLKSLLQHHSSKASILWRSAFFTVQLSHLYMTTGKTIALTRRTNTWKKKIHVLVLHYIIYRAFKYLVSAGLIPYPSP